MSALTIRLSAVYDGSVILGMVPLFNGLIYGFQMHWTNTFLTEGYVDGSGITLYFTPNLR